MFLFFPFILPVNLISYLHRVRGSQTYALLRKVPHRRRGNEEQLLSSSSSNIPFPFFYLSILNYNRFNDTKKKKKKERYRNIVSFSLKFVFFFLSYLLFSFFYTLLHFYISSKQIFPSKKKSFFPPYGDVSTTAKEG